MKVAVYYNNKDIRLEERPVPKIGSKELLVKVIASGICGSDVMEWYRIKKAQEQGGLILGHEIAGDIIEVGKEVEKYKVGDRVFVSHHVPCNTCTYCLKGKHTTCDTLRKTNFDPGGFSQYLRVPEINVDRGVFKLPDEMSYEEGAFIEPLACVVRAQRLAKVKLGDAVLILGSGISGLLHVKVAKANGATKIVATDVNDYRLEKALEFGADDVLDAAVDLTKYFKKSNDNRLADKVIVCTGALSAAEQAFKLIDRGGTVMFFAVPKPDEKLEIPINQLWKDEPTIKTTYGGAPNDIEKAIDLICSGRVPVRDMITHRLPLEEIVEGFRLVAEAKESIKVIIEPNK